MAIAKQGGSVSSPCTNVCLLDAPSGYCTGCGRTLGEIAEWRDASLRRREAIISALPSRMASLRRQTL